MRWEIANGSGNGSYPNPRASIVRLTKPEYGSLDTEELARVHWLLESAERPGTSYLIVDLSAVRFFGAGLVGVLVSTWVRLRKRKGKLILCGVRPYCLNLIRMLCLDQLIGIYPTELAALEQIGLTVPGGDENRACRSVRIRKSDVGWDPEMIRVEYIGEDNVPFRTVIVPRIEAEKQTVN